MEQVKNSNENKQIKSDVDILASFSSSSSSSDFKELLKEKEKEKEKVEPSKPTFTFKKPSEKKNDTIELNIKPIESKSESESKSEKTEKDILKELSSMLSVKPSNHIVKEQLANVSSIFNNSVKERPDINDYIKKQIEDGVKKALAGTNISLSDSTTSLKNENKETKKEIPSVMDSYSNPRKISATGKHAGVNSFIRNLGSIGFGETRNQDEREKNALGKFVRSHDNKQVAPSNNESKIAAEILEKINKRETKNKTKQKKNQNLNLVNPNLILKELVIIWKKKIILIKVLKVKCQ